jgi:Uma2 family endonuclease
MAVQAKRYTADEFWELSQQNDRRIELHDGVIVEMAASSAKPGIVASRLNRLIDTFVDEHKLGYVVTAEGGFELSPGNVVAPDVTFVSKERVPQLPDRYFKLAPDLAVEVVSPTDSVKQVLRKAAQYIVAGSRLVWIFFPDDRTVTMCRPSESGGINIQEISEEDTLSGGDVLPGFSVKVKDIFSVLDS